MDIRRKLSVEFERQSGKLPTAMQSEMAAYAQIAEGYARIEHAVAVLSDLNRHRSVVFLGRFAEGLDIDTKRCSATVPSIWEEAIFRTIHPDDLERKLCQELLFFHHISRLPESRRFAQCLMQRLRMRNRDGGWTEALHRLYYIPASDDKSVRLALCLYGAMTAPIEGSAVVADTLTGRTTTLDSSSGGSILSPQERAVLKMIDSGLRSREIARQLAISIHTVSRHRQNILAKLQVRNSVEACRTARNLAIL